MDETSLTFQTFLKKSTNVVTSCWSTLGRFLLAHRNTGMRTRQVLVALAFAWIALVAIYANMHFTAVRPRRFVQIKQGSLWKGFATWLTLDDATRTSISRCFFDIRTMGQSVLIKMQFQAELFSAVFAHMELAANVCTFVFVEVVFAEEVFLAESTVMGFSSGVRDLVSV